MLNIYPAIMGITPEEIQKITLLKGVIDRVHIDVMDNRFVPNVTQGSELIDKFAKKEQLFIWLHLMIIDIQCFFSCYCVPEGSLVSFHIETKSDIFDVIKTIKEKKCMPSIAINPKTPVKEIEPFLNVLGHVLVMSVDPGFSGQPFLFTVLEKIEELVRYRDIHELHFRIGVDGGINEDNIQELVRRGVDDFAVSSGLFSQTDPAQALSKLYTRAWK